MSELFDGVLAAGPVRELVDDEAWLQAMLDVEAALARAQAEVGLVEPADAELIAEACDASYYDAAELGAAAGKAGNPVPALVRALTERVGGRAARHAHFGATSQDIVDTAAMLVADRALAALLSEVDVCAEGVAELANRFVDTVQVGRTLSQHAVPVTFGRTAAGWLAGLDAAANRLREVRGRLVVQLGGASGTLAPLGDSGVRVLAALSRRLGLGEPALPWHTERTRIAELAAALGETCGAVRKIAGDIVLLAQTEVGELREEGPAGGGGSSSMPHKSNPVAAVAARASARQAPGLVATLLDAMAHEQQRAAGAWHAEWRPYTELLRSTGSAVFWLGTSLRRLHVDTARMRANLELTGGALLAERVTTELAPSVGRLAAHDAVRACCERAAGGDGPVAELLAADPTVGAWLTRERIEELLDAAKYLGSAKVFTERAISAHRKGKEGP